MTMKKMTIKNLCLALLASALLAACASSGTGVSGSGDADIHDPYEGFNRGVFAFNNAVDDAFINPIVLTYREVVPEPGRTGVRNFLRNLKSPMTFMNQTLQGDFSGAGDVLVRAVVNTFVGVGGIFDVAGGEGISYEQEDFGQTLGMWGVGHGPYVVLPVLGPSSMRDYFGYFVDSFADPLRWYLYNTDREGVYFAKLGADYLDLREGLIDVLADLQKSSIDYYAATRSIYYQRREALLRDDMASATDGPMIPDFDDYSDE